MEGHGDQKFLVTDNLKNIFFRVPLKKESHMDLERQEGEYMITELSFLGERSL